MSAVVGQQYAETFATGATETWTVALPRVNGASVAWTPTVADLSDGRYQWAFTPATAGAHSAVLVGSVSGDVPINVVVVTAAQSDPVAAFLTRAVTMTAPLNAATGTMTVVRGDDYLHADGRAFTFDVSGFPSLSGDSVEWRAIREGRTRITKALTVVDSDTARLELADTDTGKLRVGATYTYAVVNTDDDVTLATGSLVVSAN